MAGGLSAFMAQNALKKENEKFVVSKRFVDDGRPVAWEARALTSDEDEALRKKYTKTVQVTGKSNQYRQDFDTNAYMSAVAAACTVFPDLRDAELQNSYEVMGAEALLKRMLLPGEYTDYINFIEGLNGFTGFDEQVEEAKN